MHNFRNGRSDTLSHPLRAPRGLRLCAMKSQRLGRAALVLASLSLAASACVKSNTSTASTAPTPQGSRYSTRGTIRSFGAARAYANIAHEDIPNYMRAMTMAFEFRDATQSAGLSVGDRVRFTFEETPDGRFVLVLIARE